jgi:hypothetical protein
MGLFRAAGLLWLLPVGLILCVTDPSNGLAQHLNESAAEVGVRHSLVASVVANRDSPSAGEDGGANKATLDVSVRILDYAHDYRFYGVVHGRFSDFDLAKGGEPQTIWADPACHQDRGPPTITVLAIDGRITRNGGSSDIAAKPRFIGGRLPVDEIVVQRDRLAGFNNPNQSFIMLASTSQSHVSVKLALNTDNCRVGHQ